MIQKLSTLMILLVVISSVQGQGNPTDSEKQELLKMNQEVVRLFNEKKYSEAIPIAKKVIESTEKKYGSGTIELAKAYSNLGYVFYALDEYKSAENAFDKAVKIYKKLPNPGNKENEDLAKILETAAISKQKRDFNFAEPDLEAAALWREKVSGVDAKELVTTYFLLGDISYWKKDYKKSAERYYKVLDLIEKNKSVSKEDANMAYSRCRCSYVKAGKDAELDELWSKYKDNIIPQMPSDLIGVNGGIVNGKAINLFKPPYPQEAKASRASGTVRVEVLISKTGKILSACSRDKDKVHSALIESAEIAAYNSTFQPTTIGGTVVNVTGVIVYNFTAR
ncbi:MAG TPA: TonB family protein [Pyrinomonadaceae bacterium]|nr:TonB family protein [Pyrinomonadaceae bacterium]